MCMCIKEKREMATMTLRVGSKRNKNQVASAVIHSDRKEMQAVPISEKLLKEVGDLTETESLCCKSDIEVVIHAKSVEDQLQAVKNIGKTVLGNCSENVEMPDFVIRLFTELYLLSPVKNPLKSAIAKLFLTFTEKYQQNICSCIAEGITDLIASATVYGDLQKLNSTTTAIMCLFDNSSLGQDVMSHCVPKVLQFIHKSLTYYVQHLSKELSPVVRMEVCQYVHNTARVSVTILQKCQAQVAEVVHAETSNAQKLTHSHLSTCISYLLESPSLSSSMLTVGAISESVSLEYSLLAVEKPKDGLDCFCNPQEKINNKTESNCVENGSIIEELQGILQQILALVGYPELPMDTNSNCGLVAVLIMLRFWKNEEQDIKNTAPWDADLSSDICKLSFCSGLLNALTAEELVQIHPKTNECNITFIYHQLHGISKRSGADSALVLGVSRAMQLLSRNLCTLSISAAAVMKSQLIHGLLEFIWIHLEHYMDSVRHAATATLQNVVKLSSVLQKTDKDSQMLSTIFDAVLQLPVDRKSKYIGIATLGNEIGCQALIDRAPNIVQNLLCAVNDTTMITYVSSAIENLMIQHRNECSDEVWRTVWIGPLLKTMSTVSSVQRHVLQSLLAKVVTLNPDIVSRMLPSDSSLIETNTSQLRTLLLCLCLAHKQGAFDNKRTSPKNSEEECHSQKWKGMFDLLMLKKMLFHQDDEIRIAALALIVESHRSTEAFTSAELQLLKTFLEYNINTQVPSERQRMLALYKKTLTRLKDSCQALLRNVKLKDDKNIETSNQVKDAHTSEEQLLQKYGMFLHWLVDFCFISLFPGANFGRRCSSLQILTLIQEIIGFTSEASTWVPVATVVYTESNANILWECLKDTYENNKILAFHLLVTFPAEALGLDELEQIKSLIKVCLALISSHRPPDCITAAYILRVLVRHSLTSLALEEELSHNAVLAASKELDGVREPTVYLVVGVLLKHLSHEAEKASQNLLTAAANGPMYGTLFCIRHLLSDIDLLYIAHNKCWRDLFKEVVSLCFKLNEIVGPVVNSSSPEGHLPMDFQPGAEHLPQQDEINENKPVLNVTAQMVLLCSWRTVKEVSLFLGELVEQAPIACSEDTDNIGLVTETQVLEIGAHLATLLAETKHRGAFEQAYVGFCKLCTRLWRHSSPSLHQLPQWWLHQLMDAIAHGKGTKLCATRRSAGLPFMVQALVTTELQVGGNPTCFQQSMNTLLELAGSEEESDNQTETTDAEDPKIWTGPLHSSILQINSATEIIFNLNILQKSADELLHLDDKKNLRVEARTHASNILRALFKHSALGELVTPYVAQGLIVAIRGFKCKTWAERNSATLLFSALVTRIFGVSRSKDEISIRNRMTGRIFFQHYPILYDFLLQELKEAVIKMEKYGTMLQPALYPILLILARLYPSSLEGTDSNLQLSAYAPYVHCCSLSLVAKTRILASKALVPLLAPNQHATLLKELFTISADKDITQNQRHGLLLQAYYLLEHIVGVTPVNSSILTEVEQGIENLIWLLPNGSHTEVCLITAEVYLRILHIMAVNSFTSIPISVWEKIYQNLSLSSVQHSQQELSLGTSVGQSVYFHNEAQVYLELSLLLKSNFLNNEDFISHMENIVLHLLCYKEYNVTLVILNFLYAVVAVEYEVIEFEDSTLPVEKGFHNRIRQWNADHNGMLESMLKQSAKIGKLLANQAMDRSCCTYQECKQWIFLVLSNYPEAFLCVETEPENIMQHLLDLCEEETESISWTVLSCAASLTNMLINRSMNLSAALGNRFCDTLYKFSTSDMSLPHRLTVAYILTRNYTWLLNRTPAFTVSGVCTLWTVVMLLLDDDTSQVRELVSELALKLDCIDIPVISQKARELLIEQFVATLEDADAVACAATLFLWCLGPAKYEAGEDISEDRVFDKAEMNVFAEAATLSELSSNSLKRLINRTNTRQLLLKESLTLEMKHWFVQMCWRNHSSDFECDGLHTLLDFAKEVEKHSEVTAKECNKAACFVVPNETADILKLYQLRRLLECISVSETHEFLNGKISI